MKIKLCSPIYRREYVKPEMIESVAMLLADPRFNGSEYQDAVGTVISYNRNIAMMKGTPISEFSHILFIDSDTGFTSDHVMQLINRNCDVVSAAVEARGYSGYASVAIPQQIMDPTACRLPMNETGLHEVFWAGAGMLLIKSNVFIGWHNPWRYGLLPDGTQIGEDVQLCLDLRSKGYTIYCDMDCKVEHIGANP